MDSLIPGAAYYCGMSALKTGADSVHIFCDAAAASVIRGYTTELVIHPVLDQEREAVVQDRHSLKLEGGGKGGDCQVGDQEKHLC